MNREKQYIPYGIEWEKEMTKLPKQELIKMIRSIKTGTSDIKISEICSKEDAQRQVEGIINDFELGVITKSETMSLMGEYTARLMQVFLEGAKKVIRENPELIK